MVNEMNKFYRKSIELQSIEFDKKKVWERNRTKLGNCLNQFVVLNFEKALALLVLEDAKFHHVIKFIFP